jgi:2-dehydro-3-deoxygluconokinase
MPKVVSFGETMIRFSTTRQERLEQSQHLEVRCAGAESNFCLGCAQMGLDAVWVSKLTDNPLGRSIVNNLRRYGVSTSVIWTDSYRVGTYYIEYGSFPRSTQVIYDRDNSAIRYIEEDEIDWDLLDGTNYIHLTGITVALGEKPKSIVRRFIEEAKRRGIKIGFDVNHRAKLWSSEKARLELTGILEMGVDLLFIGIGDAKTVFGASGAPEDVLDGFMSKFSPSLAVLTLGPDGAMATDGISYWTASVEKSDTVDPIGSGDAFDSGFVASYLEGKGIEECLWFGNALAAMKRTIVGDEPIFSRKEIDDLVHIDKKGVSR